MPHYAHILTVDRLQLEVNLGFYEKERGKTQPVEVSFRIYFPDTMACCDDDRALFYDYGKLSTLLRECAQARHYNLVEFLGMEMFRALRSRIDALDGKNAKLWLRLNKIDAPVPGLQGGASFVHADLPAGATHIAAV